MNYTPTWNPPDPPQEPVTERCPKCHGEDTGFRQFKDEAHNTEVWYCWDCAIYFEVNVEIPF